MKRIRFSVAELHEMVCAMSKIEAGLGEDDTDPMDMAAFARAMAKARELLQHACARNPDQDKRYEARRARRAVQMLQNDEP